MKKLRGPDISEFNGNIDFEKLKENVDFVIMRCGYGGNYSNQEDSKFTRYANECEKYGIPYGVYLYSYADSIKAAEDEASHALSLIKGKNVTLGVWYDLEDDVLPDNKTVLTDIALAFCREIEKKSYSSGIYTSLNWINNRFENERLSETKKWIAQWNDSFDYDGNALMWQFTNHAELDGMPYPCDCNLAESSWFESDTGKAEKSESETIMVVTADIGLNVRKGASENTPVKDILKFGDIIKITETKSVGNLVWGKLSYPKKFKNCFAAINYCSVLEEINGNYTVVPNVGLNVRSSPSTSAKILRALKCGTNVVGKYRYGNWMKINSPVSGWVCSDYLEIS